MHLIYFSMFSISFLGVRKTYCDYSDFLSELCECHVYLKKDLMQFTGSFKERGARNALLSLSKADRAKGVVCASAGNHALAMAWHGKELGIPVTCVMPVGAPLAKVDKCRKFGANIVMHGMHIGESKEHAKKEFGHLPYINGYNHVDVIAGAGTMGVEILEQVPDVDVVIIPTGQNFYKINEPINGKCRRCWFTSRSFPCN
jgi:threonine dehydratase